MNAFLRTARLVLRPLTPHDLDEVVALDNDPEVMRYLNGGRPADREEVRGRSLPRLLGRGFWAAERRADGAWLGWFALEPLEAEGWRTVELGYRLRRAAWGSGYATEGGRALVDRGFGALGTERVTAQTMTVNARSRRVLEKCGLRYARTFFAEWPETIAGGEHGDVEYVLTRAEWEADRATARAVRAPEPYTPPGR
ncbi:GNAT family N-acetyltransferase [Streptomyces sp. LP05-1]|uniref:GNAT family N-acetyltransferase n=1 Tax=Streptomyces pyxinae TaxID=2970734 RepID=A0ABT2CMP9_9ACTN|nr:GNAT family N-acetyltransferase [Streptomyces sp. LP05-1]MCS0638541.1 GNAT family N-acetyltransferase [Streptomyces sp. LP05-1]